MKKNLILNRQLFATKISYTCIYISIHTANLQTKDGKALTCKLKIINTFDTQKTVEFELRTWKQHILNLNNPIKEKNWMQ